ncbi:DUF3137 domain-containing protein [Sulfurimonas sp.]
MNTFETIYTKKILPLLKELDKKRVAADNKAIYLQIVVATIIMFVLFLSRENGAYMWVVFIIGSLVFSAVGMYARFEYIKEFKKKVLHPLITSMDESFRYKPEQSFPKFLFNRSKLFGIYSKYYGDDLVKGSINDVNFMFSELHVFDERRVNNQDIVIEVFQGIFAEFDFNKNFENTLLIYPDVAEKYFGNFGKWLQGINLKKLDLVYLDSPEFEKHFIVYGNNQVEARYLLTHTMMEAIVKLYKHLQCPLYISFSNSKLYIGIEYGDSTHFEPNLNESLLEKETLYQYFKKVYDIANIVTVFKLDEYLWSKHSSKERQKSEITPTESKQYIKSTKASEEVLLRENTDEDIYQKYMAQADKFVGAVETKRYVTLVVEFIFIAVVVWLDSVMLIYSNDHGTSKEQGATWGIVVLTWFGIMYGYFYIASSYMQKYTNLLIKPLFRVLHESMQYSPKHYIRQDTVYMSHLFRDWQEYSVEHTFTCNINGLKTTASQLHIQGEDREIFHGYFFVVDYPTPKGEDFRCFARNKSYDVSDDVYYKKFENFPNNVNLRKFKYNFSVYTTYNKPLRVIDEQFIANAMSLKEDIKLDAIYISHQKNKLMFAFDFGKTPLFDISLFRSAHNYQDMKYFITLYKSMEHLVKCLNKG